MSDLPGVFDVTDLHAEIANTDTLIELHDSGDASVMVSGRLEVSPDSEEVYHFKVRGESEEAGVLLGFSIDADTLEEALQE